MKKEIANNRWFIWTIALILFASIGLWGIIEVSITKMDVNVIESNSAFITLKIGKMSESTGILNIVLD